MREPRVIKKYPNRRLYDTVTSRYVTLNAIRELVREGTDFLVHEQRTGKEITREILLQVLLEDERGSTPVLGDAALRKLIRAHASGAGAVMALRAPLERSLENPRP